MAEKVKGWCRGLSGRWQIWWDRWVDNVWEPVPSDSWVWKSTPTKVYAAVPQMEDNGKVRSVRALFTFIPISLWKFSNMHESKRIVKNSPLNHFVPILWLQSIYLCPSYFTYPPSSPTADFKANPRHYTNFIWKNLKFIYDYKYFMIIIF